MISSILPPPSSSGRLTAARVATYAGGMAVTAVDVVAILTVRERSHEIRSRLEHRVEMAEDGVDLGARRRVRLAVPKAPERRRQCLVVVVIERVHARAEERIGRDQHRRRTDGFQVLDDRRRFEEKAAVVELEERDEAEHIAGAPVELAALRRRDVDERDVGGELLLGERDADLLGVAAVDAAVEAHRAATSRLRAPARGARRSAACRASCRAPRRARGASCGTRAARATRRAARRALRRTVSAR